MNVKYNVQRVALKSIVNVKNQDDSGEKPGLVVREEDSCPRGRGFESRRILDGCKRC
jgi:hypothetical protein